MFSPRFNLKDKKADSTLIYLIISHNNSRVKISTKISIPPKYWNENTKLVRENREFPQSKEMNIKLTEIADLVVKAFDFYEKQGFEPSAVQIKLKYLELQSNAKKIVSTTQFWIYFDEFLERKRGTVDDRTIVHYDKSLRKHLLATEKWGGIPLNLINFSDKGGFIKKLLKYLSDYAVTTEDEDGNTITKGVALNTIGKQMKNIKVFLNWCFKNEYCTIFDTSHIITYQEEPENVYLSSAEIDMLLDYKPADDELVKVRDLFVIGCETGLRFSDYCRLKPEYFNGRLLKIIQTKTKDKVTIPLSARARGVLEKYDYQPPTYRDAELTVFNATIKAICKDAGITETTIMNKIIAGKSKEFIYKKYELVSSHTCRRSFCTNAFLRKIPVKAIMAVSGHKTEKSFMRYLKIGNEEIIEQFADMFE